ncbi:MAG: hypothetical protein R2771_04595 [Saprospiraceae bacterium]
MSELTEIPVLVQDTLDPVKIKCDPTTNNINFTWDLDPLALGYVIYIDGIKVDSAYVNNYLQGGLTPGDEVSIKVEAIDGGVCGNRISTKTCTAVDCPDYQITIGQHPDTICLNSSTGTIQLEANVTQGDGTGTYTWSGAGVNSSTGVFDPQVAGVGDHLITMDYEEICDTSASFYITVIQEPLAQFAVEDDHICVTDSIVINNQSEVQVVQWKHGIMRVE